PTAARTWPISWKASSSKTPDVFRCRRLRAAFDGMRHSLARCLNKIPRITMQTLHISIYALAFLVALALIFDFMNGFHDAANAIATVVSTGVLKPQTAVALAAAFNFVAILVFHLKVATTVGKGTIDPAVVDHYVVFGALVGAIVWNLITWYYGIPSSS